MRFHTLAAAIALALTGCGYHVAGHADLLPKTIKTVAIPAFGNVTARYKLTDQLPEAIAHEFIAKGTVVWEFQPGFDVVLPDRLFDLLSPAAREEVRYYGYHDVPGGTYVLSSDDDRFCNHSTDPNADHIFLLGKGAYVGAGSTITKDVPPGALALSRTPQRVIEGWVARKKKK